MRTRIIDAKMREAVRLGVFDESEAEAIIAVFDVTTEDADVPEDYAPAINALWCTAEQREV